MENKMIDKLINIWNAIPIETKNSILIVGGLIIFMLGISWWSARNYKK
jgi:hypothetical protein